MTRCDWCCVAIDSDDDPECYVSKNADDCLCENCRQRTDCWFCAKCGNLCDTVDVDGDHGGELASACCDDVPYTYSEHLEMLYG